MNQTFLKALKQNKWIEIVNDWTYQKENWVIQRDTGSWWMIINSVTNSRIFDFPEPTDLTGTWTVNLIQRLCEIDA